MLDANTSSDSAAATATPGHRAIIDGPGLVYYIYYTSLAVSGNLAHPLKTASLHEHIGPAVIAWLDRLRSCGIKIERIYFDGALPTAKQEVRLSRLETYRNQSSAFRSAYSNLSIFPDPHLGSELVNQDSAYDTLGSFQSRPIRRGRGGLPAPAFLVPAALEAILANAQYAHITKVVPGEADAYCAGYARRNGGGMILTADSDLLVYDIGQGSSVVYFADIVFDHQHQGSQHGTSDFLVSRLTCNCYSTSEIVRQLGLEGPFGMSGLAFEVEQDPSAPFSSLLRKAKAHTSQLSSSSQFQLFIDKYRDSEEMSRYTGLNRSRDCGAQALLIKLDPRISELVWQHIDQAEHSKMYLPFLLDDPARSSAWDMAASFRVLGYSILSLSLSAQFRRKCVQEVGRRGKRIASNNIPLLVDSAAIRISIADLVTLFQSFKDIFLDVSDKTRWTLFAVHEIIYTSYLNNKTPPPKSVLETLLFPLQQNKPVADWTAVHLLAQIQAVAYSLRMLRQFTEVGLALSPTSATTASFHELCQGLLTHLRTLPGLYVGYPIAEAEAGEECFDWDRVMGFVYGRLDLKDQPDMKQEVENNVVIQTSTSLLGKKKRKKKSCKGAEKNRPGVGTYVHRNIFTVLNAA
ncbi:MAG: hypothetical protein M1816_004937 [Peltula sp. TS41687]|nr:MAG: hypothetical protein M1816_004937 [Peltula sp. TS41687]